MADPGDDDGSSSPEDPGPLEADVLEFFKETAMVHRCARAVKGGVEISVYGRRYTIVRYLSPPESP